MPRPGRSAPYRSTALGRFPGARRGVPRRTGEPPDRRGAVAAGPDDALLVVVESRAALQGDAPPLQFGDGGPDAVDGEAEGRERRGGVRLLRVDEDLRAAAEREGQHPHVPLPGLLHPEAEGPAAEPAGLAEVVDREAAERLRLAGHAPCLLRGWAVPHVSRHTARATVPGRATRAAGWSYVLHPVRRPARPGAGRPAAGRAGCQPPEQTVPLGRKTVGSGLGPSLAPKAERGRRPAVRATPAPSGAVAARAGILVERGREPS
ncbi:hypothetical protein SGRIM128S_06741 [Streptomyces griseomycini]